MKKTFSRASRAVCGWSIALLLTISAPISSFAQEKQDESESIAAENYRDFAPLFPFVVSYGDPGNATSVGHLVEGPAGKDGFVQVKNGRFCTDSGPIRFNATNLTGPANFPTHEEADKLAERLARFGFNCARLHYFDAAYGTFKFPPLQGIVAPDETTQKKLDPAQRDKQDYLIAALKKRGIYVNMNLHVARMWDERDGFTGARPWADKGLDNFEPRMIQLQKEYARELLTHVNPYTKNAYVDEPAVAMIEINNENSLTTLHRGGGLKTLPDPYKSELRAQWNRWLRDKYQTTANLKDAWNVKPEPLRDEQVDDRAFDAPIEFGKKWLLEKGGTDATAKVADGALVVATSVRGEEYFPKLFRRIDVKKGQVYTCSFRIRRTSGEGSATLGLAIADTVGGWRSLGYHTTFAVGSEWKETRFVFQATESSSDAQIQITRFLDGTYEIDDLSFQAGCAGGEEGPTGSLEDGTVSTEFSFVASRAKLDFSQFLFDTERAYWTGMRSYVKDELGARQPVSGTQLGYSPASVQDDLDYVDNHAYWLHPGPVSAEWRIGNRPMVRSFGALLGMIGPRVYDKPYTVSEYNHPFPNLFGAEGQPMLRAYGRLQGWDGVFEYTYNHAPDFEPTSNTYFFSIVARTDVLAHMPACATTYLRGDVREAEKTIVAKSDEAAAVASYSLGGSNSIGFQAGGFDALQGLVHKVAVDLNDAADYPSNVVLDPKDVAPATGPIVASDTNELVWNRENPNAPYWIVDTKNTKIFTGYPEGREVKLGDVRIAVGKTRLNWATVSLLSKFAQGFGEDGKATILLAATAYCGNKEMKFDAPFSEGSAKLTDWGGGAVMAEGVPAVVVLPSKPEKTRCYALDPDGARTTEVPVEAADGGSKFAIDPKYKTIWYEIEVVD